MPHAVRRANLAVCDHVYCGEEIHSMFEQQAQQFGGWFQQQAQDQGQQIARPLRL